MNTEILTLLEAYRQMAVIRKFEERVLELSREGLIAGSVHVCLGQEAVPVGAIAALEPQDRVLATYRGHGWAIACGVPLASLLGEICQRAGGINGGRGGSAYLSSPEHRFFGETSIVGAGVPIAAGLALAAKSLGENGVVLVSIGDGAMNQGATHEGMVFAAAFSLPVIFICENNGWSEMTPTASMVRGEDLSQRGAALGIESHVVDGCDPLVVYSAVIDAAAKARRGAGPILLECKVVRLSGHYNNDIEHYRPKDDQRKAAEQEPLARIRKMFAAADGQGGDLSKLDDAIKELMDRTTEVVRAMPLPDAGSVLDHVYALPLSSPSEEAVDINKPLTEPTTLTYQRAVNAALRVELSARPEAVLYGEDVGYAGGIFGVTRGLQKEFGVERVFDTPISESAILGSAVGAAMAGMRPIVEIMWADFLFVALDQIVNQAANVRYVSRSKLDAPLVIRTQQGVTPGSCAQHSQSIEAILAHIPGIKVGMPATPDDAYAMLRAAVADPDPTVLIEARSLYQLQGDVYFDAPLQKAEGARMRREGTDLVIVTYGAMVHAALQAAERLAEDGIEASVLDLRWLSPLDKETLQLAVEKASGRVLIVHEANVTGGFGAEIAAGIQQRQFGSLNAPVTRLGAPDVRIPSSPALQSMLVPDVDAICQVAVQVAKFGFDTYQTAPIQNTSGVT